MSDKIKRVVVLFSGGLDSTVLMADLMSKGYQVTALCCKYASKHNKKELAAAQNICDSLGIKYTEVELDFIGRLFKSNLLEGGGDIPQGEYDKPTMSQTVIPFRNPIMMSIATGLAESIEAEAVAIAAHSGDHSIYPDCRPEFLDSFATSMRLGTDVGIQLLRPFANITKGEIVTRGHELGVDFSKTWSCYVGGDKHCGKCGTCVERKQAFITAGVEDPTIYE